MRKSQTKQYLKNKQKQNLNSIHFYSIIKELPLTSAERHADVNVSV